MEHDLAALPAYGGDLFDPDRPAFLEGRAPGSSWKAAPAQPFPIHNRTVLHMLEALQFTIRNNALERLNHRSKGITNWPKPSGVTGSQRNRIWFRRTVRPRSVDSLTLCHAGRLPVSGELC